MKAFNSKKGKHCIIVLIMIFAILFTFFSCKQDQKKPSYGVTYDANGATTGTAPEPGTKTHDVAYTLATNSGNLAKTGFTFAGWNTKADGSGTSYAEGATYSANENLGLFAKWEAVAAEYTIKYDANGATGTVPADQTKTHNEDIYLARNTGNLIKAGYTFVGWNTNTTGTGTSYAPGASYSGNGNIKLYAQFDTIPMIQVLTSEKTIVGATDGTGAFPTGRSVILSTYEISKYEVTQELYESVMGRNPSEHQGSPVFGDNPKLRPVENVTWLEAVTFCNELTKLVMRETDCVYGGITASGVETVDYTKKGYRLPTEAEWECAARGGEPSIAIWNLIYSGSDELDPIAWYNGNSSDGVSTVTHEVGKLDGNRLGIHDMTGNVSEWCWDGWSGVFSTGEARNPMGNSASNDRVMRGGGFNSSQDEYYKNRYRARENKSSYKSGAVGFRLCRTTY